MFKISPLAAIIVSIVIAIIFIYFIKKELK